MLTRLKLAARVTPFAAAALLAVASTRLGAQGSDPIDDLITRVLADLNDLRYADAIRRGREVLATGRTMSPAQEALLRSTIAAAYFPEEADAQRPDSAIAQFTAALAVQPDLTLPVELRWPGLDSLLTVARSRSFVLLASAEPQTIVGPDGRGRVEVQSSRVARFTLQTSLLGSAVAARQDVTTTAGTRATLQFRAHDGRDVLLTRGEYVATIVATDPVRGDSVLLRRRMLVDATPIMFVAPPALDSARLRPETRRPSFRRTFVTSLVLGTATFVVAALNNEDDFGEDFRPNSGKVALGAGVFAVGMSTYWLRGERRDERAVAANREVRDAHRRAVEAADAENSRRIRDYRVTVSFP
jgi:hypothetical protein